MVARNVKPGDRVGRLTLVEEVPKEPNSPIGSHRKSRRFRFKCDCGGETITTWGSAQSCGCVQIEIARRTGTAKAKPVGEAMFNMLYAQYCNRATRDGIEFRLTREQFKGLTSGNCFYCGAPPAAVKKAYYFRKFNGAYTYNGIDRVNSDQGYIIENSVSCCPQCNFAKHAVSQSDFFDWIKRVHAYLSAKHLL